MKFDNDLFQRVSQAADRRVRNANFANLQVQMELERGSKRDCWDIWETRPPRGAAANMQPELLQYLHKAWLTLSLSLSLAQRKIITLEQETRHRLKLASVLLQPEQDAERPQVLVLFQQTPSPQLLPKVKPRQQI